MSEQTDYDSKGKREDVGSQLVNYGKQMRDLLSASKADIRTYKFSVEKTEEGFDLDVAIKISFNNAKRVSENESGEGGT
ncbi:MAG: hypothetical protein PXY39_08725 [archaeon]|nr:hypothetical protein [archaeon]